MAKKSRVKGQRGQNEFAKRLPGGTVLARAGYDGADVQSDPVYSDPIVLWEVKRRKALPQWLRDWQQQALLQVIDSPHPPVVAFREDHGQWWVMLPLSAFDV